MLTKSVQSSDARCGILRTNCSLKYDLVKLYCLFDHNFRGMIEQMEAYTTSCLALILEGIKGGHSFLYPIQYHFRQ